MTAPPSQPTWPPDRTPRAAEDQWTVRYTRTADAQISDGLPRAVAEAAFALLEGALADNPYRVSKRLGGDLDGLRSARVGRDHRILFALDESSGELTVLDIDRRSRGYRTSSPAVDWIRRRRRQG